MRWFERTRIEWIVEMIHIYGFINRKHVCKKFNVSEQVASKDFQTVLQDFPGLMVYDSNNKCYVSNLITYKPTAKDLQHA